MRFWMGIFVASLAVAETNLDDLLVNLPKKAKSTTATTPTGNSTGAHMNLESAPYAPPKSTTRRPQAPTVNPTATQPSVQIAPTGNLDNLFVKLPTRGARPQSPAPTRDTTGVKTSYRRISQEEATRLSSSGATLADLAVIDAIRNAGGKSTNGIYDPRICRVLRPYAEKLARQGHQDGHAGFKSNRFPQLVRLIGGMEFGEVTSESGLGRATLAQHGKDCVDTWFTSRRHTDAIMSSHDRYCYVMVKNQRGRGYFCAAIFGN